MKYSLYSLLIIIFLFSIPGTAHAGFVIKNHSAVTAMPASKASLTNAATPSAINNGEHHSRLYNTIQQLTHLRMAYHRRPSEWVGIVALLSGVLGLFVPGINFLAILFGVLGMGRKCNAKGLAVAGFILGMLELLVFLIAGGTILSFILL